MYTGGDSAGKWNDDPSDGRVSNIKGYVCSYRYACAEGYMLEPKERKRCFRFVQSPQSWEGAESFCRADVPGKGSDLATIATETENAFVLSLIQGAPGWAHRSYSRPTWIGCNARRSSAEHLIATKALRCTATAWMLIVAESFAIF